MAEYKFDQFTFSSGEFDPRTQSRADIQQYYTAAKQIRNAQVIPQGGVQRRWGLNYVDTCTVGDATRPLETEISVLLYDNDIQYLLLWEALSLKIYLENLHIATVVTTYTAEDTDNLRFTQVENRLIITNAYFTQRQLVRSNNAANVITGVDATNDYITVTNAITVDLVYPATFTTGGTLPVTNPQIYAGRQYFIVAVTATNIRVYATSADAFNDVNYFDVISTGTGSLIVQNTWTLSDITFINKPAYDFSGGYSAITFTPSATSGAVTVTLSAPLANLTSAVFVGGVFSGNGGILRITAVADTSHFSGYTVSDFAGTGAIQGAVVFLGEPAWSAVRGYPRLASFFQNRLVFAGTSSLPNGVWLSVVNEAYYFDDSESLPDSANSWYPAGGTINYIIALTSARSLIAHTNNGAYSTPLLSEAPVTPTNFVLTEQNKFSCDTIQPIFIDNQIIFVDTASNVVNMIWEITQSAYITNNISVMSSSLINSPVDMTSFYEPAATDGFYAFIVNEDGTMAVYQTLHEQNVGAWSLMNTKTTPTIDQNDNFEDVASNFVRVTSGFNRCWVLVQRQIPVAGTPHAITAFSPTNTLTAAAHGMTVDISTLVRFTTTGSLPVTDTQINITEYWFARALTTSTFALYTNAADADADTNRITITSAGVNSNVIAYVVAPKLYIEEIDFNFYVDAGDTLEFGSPVTSISGLSYLNGLVVNVKGDSYVLQNRTVFNGGFTTEAAFDEYQIGLPFTSTLQALPVSIPGLAGMLYNPTHVRAVYVRYYQTVGAQFQGFDIPVITMQDVVIGEPVVPQDGVYLYTPMEGWDTQSANITVTQALPLPMTILGFSYVLES